MGGQIKSSKPLFCYFTILKHAYLPTNENKLNTITNQGVLGISKQAILSNTTDVSIKKNGSNVN